MHIWIWRILTKWNARIYICICLTFFLGVLMFTHIVWYGFGCDCRSSMFTFIVPLANPLDFLPSSNGKRSHFRQQLKRTFIYSQTLLPLFTFYTHIISSHTISKWNVIIFQICDKRSVNESDSVWIGIGETKKSVSMNKALFTKMW